MHLVPSLYAGATSVAKWCYSCIGSQLFSGDLAEKIVGAADNIYIEEQIHQLVQHDETIKKNYDLLVSVPGIGHLTSIGVYL